MSDGAPFFSAGFFSAGFFSNGFWGESSRSIAEVEIDFSKKPSAYRDTLDLADTWIPKKIRRIIQRVAKEVVEKDASDAQEHPTAIDSTALLLDVLASYGIAFKRAYDDFLQQQIEAYRADQIRRLFEIAGIYQQIEMDDEQAILMLMMDM